MRKRQSADDQLDGSAALALARKCSELVATKGQKTISVAVSESISDTELLALLLGPTRRLRAPSLIAGRIILVGFREEMYRDVLGRPAVGTKRGT